MSNPSPEALLEHVGFLRAVARGLLRNEADAEDVVQQTLVAAMEKPPADDGNLKGWLASVARNLARMQFRTRKRRLEREAKVARTDGTPSTAEIAERLEMEKRVVDAVATLEEPFRTMVVLRYYDGLKPKQIAERLGIPAATVRTRLSRGLEKMRGDLEKRSGGRSKMLAGLLLLAQLPAQAASPWPARLVATGGVAAVVVCVVTVAWLVREDRPEPARERAEVARGPATDFETEAPAEPRKRPVATISGRVVDGNRRALADAEVVALPHEGPGHLETPATRVRRFLARPEPVARTRTDEEGRYEFALPEGSPVWIVARKEGHAIDAFPLLEASGVHEQADLQIRETAGVSGTLIDADGEPLRGVPVHGWDSRFAPEFVFALATTRTDQEGNFRLPFRPASGESAIANSNRLTLVVDARSQGYLVRVLRDRRPPLGTIRIEKGPPGELRTEPGSTVYLFGRDRFGILEARNGTAGWEDSLAWFTVVVDHPDFAPGVGEWLRDVSCEIPLSEVPLIEGSGELPGAEVGGSAPAEFFKHAMFGIQSLRVAVADSEGRYAIRTRGALLVAHASLSPPGLRLPAARIEGHVLDGDARPVAGARVTATPPFEKAVLFRFARRYAGSWTAISRPDGSFVLDHLPLPAGDPTLAATHPGRGLQSESEHRATSLRMVRMRGDEAADRAEPGAPQAEKRAMRATDADSGALEGFVYGPGGAGALANAEVAIEDRPESAVRTDAIGFFRIPVDATGPYFVVVRKEGVGSGRFEWTRIDRRADLRIPQWEPFVGRVLYRAAPIENAYVRSFVMGRVLEETRADSNGRFSLRCTPFDRKFSLSIDHPGFLTAWIENPAEGDIEMERAAPVRLRVVDEEGRALSGVEIGIDGRTRRSDLDGHVDVHRKSKNEMSIALEKAGQDWILAGEVEWSDDGALGIVRVRRGLRIEGEVRDAGNRPVAHVLVVAEPLAEGRPTRRAFTNAQGRFVLRTLHPQRYRLRVAEEKTTTEVDAGREGVVLRKEAK